MRHDVEQGAVLLLRQLADGVQRLVPDLALRLIDNAEQPFLIRMVADQLQVCDGIAYLLAVVEARASHHAVWDRTLGKGTLYGAGLRIGAVQYGKIVEATRGAVRAGLCHHAVDGVHNGAGFCHLILRRAQDDFFALTGARPKVFAPTPLIMRNNPVRRLQNGTGRAIVLLQLDDPRIAEAPVEAENILDGRPAELVNGLVIVTHHHQVMVPAGQNDRQLQLCLVGILILVDADVAEFLLIVFPDVIARAEQAHCLHDDIIKVHRVGARQLGGILPVNGSNLPCPVIGTSRLGGILRRAQFILLPADGIHHAPDGKLPVIDIHPLEDRGQRFLLIFGVVNGKGTIIPDAVPVPAEHTHTHGMEGSRPDILCHLLVTQLFDQPLAYLACCLVGKGDCQHPVGRAGIGDKLRQDTGFNFGGTQRRVRRSRRLQFRNACLCQILRHIVVLIRVAVPDDEGNAAHQHRGLAASGACQHQHRSFRCVYRFPLLQVQPGVHPVEQGTLCGKVARIKSACRRCGKFCHGHAIRHMYDPFIFGFRNRPVAKQARRGLSHVRQPPETQSTVAPTVYAKVSLPRPPTVAGCGSDSDSDSGFDSARTDSGFDSARTDSDCSGSDCSDSYSDSGFCSDCGSGSAWSRHHPFLFGTASGTPPCLRKSIPPHSSRLCGTVTKIRYRAHASRYRVSICRRISPSALI